MNSNIKEIPGLSDHAISKSSLIQLLRTEGLLVSLNLIFKKIGVLILKLLVNIFRLSKMNQFLEFFSDRKINYIVIGASDEFNFGVFEIMRKNTTIHFVEPNKYSCKYIEKLKIYWPDQVKIYNLALSNSNEKRDLYIYNWSRASSFYKPNLPFTNKTFLKNHYQIINTKKIDVMRLDQISENIDIDFIKMDAEGAEYDILQGSQLVLQNCIGLEVEVCFNENIYFDRPLFSDIDNYCREKGFTLLDLIIPQKSYWHYLLPTAKLESKGFLAIGDALYIKTPEKIIQLIKEGQLNVEKIHTASAIYLCYNNYEFAYTLNKLALNDSYFAIHHDDYARVIGIVEKFAGSQKLVSYPNIKKVATFVSMNNLSDSFKY